MGRIYEMHCRDQINLQENRTKFHEEWSGNSGNIRGIILTILLQCWYY
jgi:hypothetical protein